MASQNLIEFVDSFQPYYESQGKIVDERLIESCLDACQVAYLEENDIPYAKTVSEKAKFYIEDAIKHSQDADGNYFDDFLDLDYTVNAAQVNNYLTDSYYEVLKYEAPYVFDSYMLYLEKNRLNEHRFFANRAKQFRKLGVVQAMQDLEDDKLDILAISLPPGVGKALAMDAKVLTPTGFVRNDSLRVGDVVIAGNGNEATVLGVFPQGKKEMYDVVFDDGSKVRCSKDHLWTVQTREDRLKRNRYRTIPLSDIMKNHKIEKGRRLNYSVDYVKPIQFSEKEFIIHPYVMGVLIGNGDLHATPSITTADGIVVDTVNKFLPDGYTLKYKAIYTYMVNGHEGNNCKAGSIITRELKRYGLHGKSSPDKHIPKDYLYASIEQRTWLLKGLMDTDGTVSNSTPSYCTTSAQLAEDVAELVHSLGGYAKINIKKKCGYKKNGEYIPCKPAYNITIQFDSSFGQISLLKRKEYFPKRTEIKRFIKDIIPVGEEECQCIYISDESHLYITDDYVITHNSTLEKFFATWVVGRHLDDYSLFFTHSDEMADIFYRGVIDIAQNDEYAFMDIFSACNVFATDAKAKKINFVRYHTFANIQCTSVGAKNAGKVRANRYLYCDDLISSIEEALNKAQLDKIWRIYTTDARQRKLNQQVKEIHIATRWSTGDVIGRLKEVYSGNERARFLSAPDIDPVTGESNFDYRHEGMSKEFFHDIALTMDDVTYKCLYKNEPIEREGLLYHEDELRRYNSLPEGEPDAIIGICDTKTTGIDYMFLPCFYQYGDDYYLEDCVCDNGVYSDLYPKMTDVILENNMQLCEFESNAGGTQIADEVEKRVKESGGRCVITRKPTETNKETRILASSPWIIRHILFKDKDRYAPKSDYGIMINLLLTYSIVGRNRNDDVPDGLSNFYNFVTNQKPHKKARIIKSPI